MSLHRSQVGEPPPTCTWLPQTSRFRRCECSKVYSIDSARALEDFWDASTAGSKYCQYMEIHVAAAIALAVEFKMHARCRSGLRPHVTRCEDENAAECGQLRVAESGVLVTTVKGIMSIVHEHVRGSAYYRLLGFCYRSVQSLALQFVLS